MKSFTLFSILLSSFCLSAFCDGETRKGSRWSFSKKDKKFKSNPLRRSQFFVPLETKAESDPNLHFDKENFLKTKGFSGELWEEDKRENSETKIEPSGDESLDVSADDYDEALQLRNLDDSDHHDELKVNPSFGAAASNADPSEAAAIDEDPLFDAWMAKAEADFHLAQEKEAKDKEPKDFFPKLWGKLKRKKIEEEVEQPSSYASLDFLADEYDEALEPLNLYELKVNPSVSATASKADLSKPVAIDEETLYNAREAKADDASAALQNSKNSAPNLQHFPLPLPQSIAYMNGAEPAASVMDGMEMGVAQQ